MFFAGHCQFHPVVHLPANYEVLDFSLATTPRQVTQSAYTIGRYNEKRPSLYTQALFQGQRNHHIGIDIGAPAGSAVHAFYGGEIFLFANNQGPGDYGPTIVTRHSRHGQTIYALHGHLSAASLENKITGQKIVAGEVIGWIGAESENGGWPPHLHFQLSFEQPDRADMPGTVCDHELEEALKIYPDPRLVLGPLY